MDDGWDFEEGGLDGWTRTGDAFANQPTFGNNIEQRRPGASPGQFGQWWIGTYENRPTPSAPAGQVQGDGPQGTLISPPFRIETLRIDFVIGGGNDPEREAVNLLVKQLPSDPPPRPGSLITLPDGNYFVARTETGRNDDRMEFAHWNVSTLLNREARVQIVDLSSAPWGHINVDSFRGIYFRMPTEPDLPPDPNGPPSGLEASAAKPPAATAPDSLPAETATLPLPPELRPSASIVSIDKAGKVAKLRSGSGKMICIADAPGDDVFDARCYHRDFVAILYRMKQFAAAGVPEDQFNVRLEKELKAGKLHITMKPTAGYRMLGPVTALTKDGTGWTSAMSRWQSIHIPRARAEDLGLLTRNDVPMLYVMSSGELWAHVMINGPAD